MLARPQVQQQYVYQPQPVQYQMQPHQLPAPVYVATAPRPVVRQQRPVWVPDSASSVCMLDHCRKPIGVGNRLEF